MKTKRHFAFSLLELLVVIAALALIAVFVWPIFARSREEQRSSACRDNLKQLVLAIAQYKNDYDEYYPLIAVSPIASDEKLMATSKQSPYGWADALLPYIKNTRIYQCPSDNRILQSKPNSANYTDYWFNANFIYLIPRNGTFIVRSGGELRYGAHTVLLGDGGGTNNALKGDARYNICGDGTSLSGNAPPCSLSKKGLAVLPAAQIHLNGCNLAFADGHVKWMASINSSQCAMFSNNNETMMSLGDKYTFSLLARIS